MGTGSLASGSTGTAHPELATILVIEDDKSIRRLIRRMLEFEGFEVLEAPDGTTGLSLIESAPHPIHLVVTDFDMPGLRGDMVASLLRRRLPGLPLLCISGAPEIAAPAFPQGGTTHFLEKPFSAGGLIQHVRELLAAAH